MLKKPVISIIVPMYNSEETIGRCLDSLVGQTLQDLEIILIDDASKDSTAKVVQNYILNYKNIILLQNEENKGAGFSKNTGLAYANAEIIGFCDSDDYVDNDYYEKLYKAMTMSSADIACCDAALVYKWGIQYLDMLKDSIYDNVYRKNYEAITHTEPIEVTSETAVSGCTAASATTKLFKKSIVGKFYGGVCDDLMFTYPALLNASSIVYVPNNYYYYVQSDESLERMSFNERRIGLADSLTLTVENMMNSGKNIAEHSKIIYAYSAWGILLDILKDSGNRENNLNSYWKKLKYRELLRDNEYLTNLLLSKSLGEQRFILDLLAEFLKQNFGKTCELYDAYGDCPEMYLPKVSIVIPVYNGANYLREAIVSAIGQVYPNLEIIVVNDGSNDDGKTEQIAKSFGSRITYFYKENGGVASALNYGIERMTGEYFAWLSHDDLYKEDKILRQVEALKDLMDKRTMVVCGYEVVNEKREKLYDVNPLEQYTKEQLETPLFAVFRGCINGCATLIHKSHFERVGMFDTKLPTTQDYDLWFRMTRNQKICYMPGCYVLSRTHSEQDSRKLFDKHLKECYTLWIGLMKKLTLEEMCEMSGTEYGFYLEERNFFMQSPYKKVVTYLEGRLLELLKDSWEKRVHGTMIQMSTLFSLSPDVVWDNEILKLSMEPKDKIAIILDTKNRKNEQMWCSIETICRSVQDKKYVCICLDEKTRDMQWLHNGKIIQYPQKGVQSLSHLLKLFGCKTVIISNGEEWKNPELYTACSAMEMTVIAWNLSKHWIFEERKNITEKAHLIMGMQDVDISVWSDMESAKVAKILLPSATFIPLQDNVDKREEIVNSWKKIIGDSDKGLKVQNDMQDIDDTIVKIMIKSQEAILKEARENNQDVKTVERTIYLSDNEEYWKERCEAILNSTSWKMTKWLRILMDKVKSIMHTNNK